MVDYLIKRPMCLCAVTSSFVCIIGFYNKNALLIVGVLIITVLFTALYKQVKPTLIFSLFFILLIIISTFSEISEIYEVSYFSGYECGGEYIVIEEPELMGDYYVTTLEVKQSEILKDGMKISTVYYEGDIKLSDCIEADISLKSLESSKYKASSYSEEIFLSGYMSNIKLTGETDFVLENIAKVRKYIETKIFDNYGFSEAATILALITGDNSYFSDEFYSNLKCSGVTHVMVVSGMHLSVIVAFMLYIVERFLYNRYLKALVIFFAVLTVSAVCGFTMSIMRAGITYILVSLSLLLERPNTPENALGGAVSIILLNSPFAIFNIAFQLSVLSTFGILVVALPIARYLKGIIKTRLLFEIVSAILISLSATVMTAPIVIYYFGYISNVLLITNLLVCYPSTVALVLTILGLIFPILQKPLFYLSDIIIKYINAVINYFGSLPFAVTRFPEYVAFIAAGVILILLLILLACKKRIDMLKLKEVCNKKIREGGKRIKWQ